jgi:hypothetical protein
MRTHAFALRAALVSASTALVWGCRDRGAVWDQIPGPLVAHGLSGAAAIVDDSAHRVLLLPVEADLTLSPASVRVGHGVAASGATPDRSRLVVLTHGDVPRDRPDAQAPTVTVIDGSRAGAPPATYTLSDPLSGLSLDPASRFAVVYPTAADNAFVQNPNELSIADITAPPSASNPIPLTLRSFGGKPQSFFFTPTLELPGGPRRLLAVLTDRDVGIIDLSAPALGDITVQLSSSAEVLSPAQVAVTDGAPGVTSDARLAVRIAGDSSVVLIDLLPVPAGDTTHVHDFLPTPNLVDAGGPPSDIAFVTTDGGLRLAALVPAHQALVLIDPSTGVTTSVDLGAPLDHLSVVTGIVGPSAMGADVALLWSTSSPTIAFVALGSTVGKPYKSVEKLSLATPVGGVIDVPEPNDRLKILASPDQQTFFVLDLVARTVSPLLASSGGADVTVSPGGRRAWFLAPSAPVLASLDLHDLHPENLVLGQPAALAFDVARRDGGRALVALHRQAAVDVTVLDGDAPSLATAVEYSSVLLGGVP